MYYYISGHLGVEDDLSVITNCLSSCGGMLLLWLLQATSLVSILLTYIGRDSLLTEIFNKNIQQSTTVIVKNHCVITLCDNPSLC